MSEKTQRLHHAITELHSVMCEILREQERQEEKKPEPQKTEWDLGGGTKVLCEGYYSLVRFEWGVQAGIDCTQIKKLYDIWPEIARIKGISLPERKSQ